MKKSFVLVFIISIISVSFAQHSTPGTGAPYVYPLFRGDYPDPSVLRDGEDYYMVHSSFDYYPGLLIWHSTDLVNWEPVTHALTKFVGSVWAPDLVKHNDKFYIYFPADGTNYVVTADAIEGPWSDPVDLEIGSIDPGHVTDDAGKRYLYFSNGRYAPLSTDGLAITGKARTVYRGWPIPGEWSIECFCQEGPKLVKHGEYYYLTVAQGGTAGPPTSHMVVSARSKSPLGPWENSPYNPVIRTYDRSEKWWSKGHGTLFDDAKGQWWMAFHGYENGFYTMGRQTLLQPMEWTLEGWFKAQEGVEAFGRVKELKAQTSPAKHDLSDDFSNPSLDLQWQFYKEYDPQRFQLEDNSLVLQGKGNTVGESSPLLCVPVDHAYEAQVELHLEGDATAGLVLFYNENAYAGIGVNKESFFSFRRAQQRKINKKPTGTIVFLRLKNQQHTVDMYYSFDGVTWHKMEKSVDVGAYHHNAFGGFISLRLGLSVYGNGKAKFKDFRYTAL